MVQSLRRLSPLVVSCGFLLFLAGCDTPLINNAFPEPALIAPTSEQQSMNIDSLSDVIRTNPEDASAYNMRGTAYGSAKSYNEAIADFSKAIEIDPSYFQAFANRALIYVNLRQYDKAQSDFAEALTLSPEYPVAYFGRALLYRTLNKEDLALSDLNKVLEHAPDHAGAYFNRGEIYLNKHENDLALADFNSAIDLAPEEAEPYYGRGLSRIANGNYKEAYDDFYVAARRREGFYQAWTYRGLSAEKQNAPEEAIRAYQRALSIKPDYQPALEGMKRSQNMKGTAS